MTFWKKLIADGSWADGRRLPASLLIGITTFGILVLELALIRWTTSQVRIFAYFNNLVLIGAFLGMGLGVALGRRHPGLVHFVLPVLLIVALPFALAEPLQLVHLPFPDSTVALWGAEFRPADPWIFVRNITIFIALLLSIVAVFVCAGAPLGHLFARAPVLRAYTADLVGSLAGIIVFTLVSSVEGSPPVWLALGCVPFLILARRAWAVLPAIAVVVLGQYSVQGAMFSPYNRIALTEQPLFKELQVNRDFHQYLHNFSSQRLADPALSAENRAVLAELRDLYDLPFAVNTRHATALVVGAGTGNDVQAALRNGYQGVTSVDIDGRIIAIGRAQHPEQPYSVPGVRTVVDDARSFFEKSRDEKYDVVCYGLLDSHAMSSAMSTLRLDNYVYTEEGIRAAWNHVAQGGHLSLAISCGAGPWFFERLFWTITRATGREPLAFVNRLHGLTMTFVVPREGATFVASEVGKRTRVRPITTIDRTLTTSDDWPFLYIRPGIFPWGYLIVIGVLLVVATVSVRRVFDFGRGGATEFDWPLFLMGAAFLLIETRGVTSMSLLFGSTWVVNSAVFTGILLMVLAANLAVDRWRVASTTPWFCALFAAVALLYVFPVAWLHTLPIVARGLVGGLLTGLPVGCAGVIVSALLARSAQPVSALGANLLGAVLGGCLEYYSMIGGLRSTALLALVLYLCAFLAVRKSRRAPTGAAIAAAAVA